MRYWTFTLAICTTLAVGCQRSITVSNPDGDAASLGELWLAPMLIVRCAAPLAYLVLAAAALVSWRHYRRYDLLLLCLAVMNLLVGKLASVAAYAPMRGATINEMRSGAALPIAWLLNFANSLTAVGYVLAILGGVITLRCVMRTRQFGAKAEQSNAPERRSRAF